jgi:hypothetical protein
MSLVDLLVLPRCILYRLVLGFGVNTFIQAAVLQKPSLTLHWMQL